MPVQCMTDTHGYMICKINRNSITNHFISHIHIRIEEYEIIRESLHACDFTDRHPSIQMLLTGNKNLFIFLNLNHFRSLRMQLALPPACLNREARFVPAPHSVTGHKNRRKSSDKILMVQNPAHIAVCMVLFSCRQCCSLQIPDGFT